MVPSSTLLISMTFLTVCEAIQLPAVARESVATTMPPWKRKASVVVPWAILMGQLGFARSSVAARSHAEGCQGLCQKEMGKQEGRGWTNLGYRGHGKLDGQVLHGADQIEVLGILLDLLVLLVGRTAVPCHEAIHVGGRLCLVSSPGLPQSASSCAESRTRSRIGSVLGLSSGSVVVVVGGDAAVSGLVLKVGGGAVDGGTDVVGVVAGRSVQLRQLPSRASPAKRPGSSWGVEVRTSLS
jgi:hypothetical protein